MVKEYEHDLAEVFRVEEITGLCARIAGEVWRLMHDVGELPDQNRLQYLDRHRPGWRKQIPLRLEDEVAEALFMGLVKDAAELRRRVQIKVRCELQRAGEEWEILRRLDLRGSLEAASLHQLVFKNFGDLWVGDYHHGPLVLGPSGTPTLAKIGAFLDHCTRYPVADRYYPAENITTLRDTMLRAFMSFGLPVKVYVDRGAVYRAEQLHYSLDRVGTHLVHSKAYYSEGRGVIERWWQTIKQFEHEVRQHQGLYTIHELNRLWEAFRQLRYCEEVHSEIGMTPQEAIAEVKPRSVDPQVLRELFLVREDRTVHKKDSCVQLFGRRYLCDRALRGQRVQVRFDPSEMPCPRPCWPTSASTC